MEMETERGEARETVTDIDEETPNKKRDRTRQDKTCRHKRHNRQTDTRTAEHNRDTDR